MYSAVFSSTASALRPSVAGRTARWNAETGSKSAPLKGHEKRVGRGVRTAKMASSPHQRTTARLERRNREQIGAPLRGQVNARSGIYPGRHALSNVGRQDGAAVDVKPQADRAAARGHEDRVWSAAFSPDSKRILTASLDKTARLWDTEIGELLTGHEEEVNSAVFSPDGTRIVTASDDRTVRRWDADTRKQIGEPLTGHTGFVWRAAFSPDGKYIVTASRDKTARLWDAETGKPIGAGLRYMFSPDGKRIATASASGNTRSCGETLSPTLGSSWCTLRPLPHGALPPTTRGFPP